MPSKHIQVDKTEARKALHSSAGQGRSCQGAGHSKAEQDRQAQNRPNLRKIKEGNMEQNILTSLEEACAKLQLMLWTCDL